MRPAFGHGKEGCLGVARWSSVGLLALMLGSAEAWALDITETSFEGRPHFMIRTERAHLHYGDEEGIARVAATVPLGRLGEPGDVGNACLFLASPLASYVSGAELLVHGGGERPAYLAAAAER